MEALALLFARPYWQRTWILQEVALAKQVVFRCGKAVADFRSLRGTMEVINRRSQSSEIPALPLMEGRKNVATLLIFRDFDAPVASPVAISYALLQTQGQQVKDLRDKVYGIINITHDGPRIIPQPTYEKSTESVYTQLTKGLILTSQRLDWIRYKNPQRKSQLTMPSWTLDLSTRYLMPLHKMQGSQSQSLSTGHRRAKDLPCQSNLSRH